MKGELIIGLESIETGSFLEMGIVIQGRDDRRRDERYGHRVGDVLPTFGAAVNGGRVDLTSAAPARQRVPIVLHDETGV